MKKYSDLSRACDTIAEQAHLVTKKLQSDLDHLERNLGSDRRLHVNDENEYSVAGFMMKQDYDGVYELEQQIGELRGLCVALAKLELLAYNEREGVK